MVKKKVYISSTDDLLNRINPIRINIKPSLKNVTSMRLVRYSIPNTIYNIDTFNNNFHAHDINNTSDKVEFNITPGNYSIDDLIIELNSQYDTANAAKGVPWACTSNISYSTVTSKVTLDFTGTTVAGYEYVLNNNSIFPSLGIKFTNGDLTSPKTGEETVNFFNDIFIHCNHINTALMSSEANPQMPILHKVFDSVAYGSLFYENEIDTSIHYIPKQNISYIDIALKHYNLDLCSINSRWSLELEVECDE